MTNPQPTTIAGRLLKQMKIAQFRSSFGLRAVRLRTRAAVLDCLATELELLGLRITKSCHARHTLSNIRHEEMNISIYVAMKDKDKRQKACFTVSGFMNPERPWFMFVVQPWGNVYLRRREEVMENLGEKALRDDTAYITISKGRRDFLFENRFEELINDKENWSSQPEVVDAELKRLRDKVTELEDEVERLKAAVKFAKWDGKHWCV